MIPPLPEYRNPDISDTVASTLPKQGKQPNPIYASRISDKAENILTILKQVVIELNLGPVIAVRGLEVHMKEWNRKPGITSLFPEYDWNKFTRDIQVCFGGLISDEEKNKKGGDCELDWILIGPEIGVVVIEVKSTSSKHFGGTLKYALGQASSVDVFTKFLQEQAGVQQPVVRKVIFTPNLCRKQYEKWKQGFEKQDPTAIFHNKINGVNQWFKDDIANDNGTKMLKDYFAQRVTGMSEDAYISYASVIASLASMTSTLCHDVLEVRLDEANLFESAALLQRDKCFKTQNLFAASMEPKRRTFPSLKKVADIPNEDLNEYMKKALDIIGITNLTISQLEVLKCTEKFQFILGAAGTGKTVLLQTKALELLQMGENVCIWASTHSWKMNWLPNLNKAAHLIKGICVYYRDYFHPAEWLWSAMSEAVRQRGLTDHAILHVKGEQYEDERDCRIFGCRKFNGVGTKKTLALLRELCDQPRHMMIDDECDLSHIYGPFQDFLDISDDHCEIRTLIPAMQIILRLSPSLVTWLAMDPSQINVPNSLFQNDENWRSAWIMQEKYLAQIMEELETKSQTILTEVMRCSEEVFSYAFKDIQWPASSFCNRNQADLKAPLGHKIPGKAAQHYEYTCERILNARTYFCSLISELVLDALNLISFSDVTVISLGNNDVHRLIDCLIDALPQRFVHYISDDLPKDDTRPGITVANFDDISSLEWPFVIIVGIICVSEIHEQTDRLDALRYLARSRARTAVLAEVFIQVTNEDE